MVTSTSHLADVAAAIRTRILSLDTLFNGLVVEVGNPAEFHPRADTAPPLVTLFIYRIEPDNAALLATPDSGAAMHLHALITAYCSAGETPQESAGTFELRILSHIIRLFLEAPELGPIRLRDVLPIGPLAALVSQDLMVEARQMAPDMEEINHIWTTQADAPYHTSLVYRFAFGIVTPSQPSNEGPPVLRTALEDPADPDPNAPGATPAFGDTPQPAPEQGALTFNLGTALAPQLAAGIDLIATLGDLSLPLIAVTETAETLDLLLERFDAATGTWIDATADLAPVQINSRSRAVLAAGGPLAPDIFTFTDPGVAGVWRLSGLRAADPASLLIAPIFLTVGVP